jgi:hypothetical protein
MELILFIILFPIACAVKELILTYSAKMGSRKREYTEDNYAVLTLIEGAFYLVVIAFLVYMNLMQCLK